MKEKITIAFIRIEIENGMYKAIFRVTKLKVKGEVICDIISLPLNQEKMIEITGQDLHLFEFYPIKQINNDTQ